jgi:uncharacterized HAD superfamily protein
MKKQPKLIIGVDLDDVVIDFSNALHAYHNERYGTSVKKGDMTSYGFENVWNCTEEEASKKVFEFYSTNDHDTALPVPGASEALALLKEAHELHIISSRADQIADLTFRWIDKNFPNHFKSVNLTNQYFGTPEKVRSKADVCRELHVDVMIEDSLSQAKEIALVVSKVFLLDCPWNQGELPKNVMRVYSWADIIAQFK